LQGALALRQVRNRCIVEYAEDCFANISPHLALSAAAVTSACATVVKTISRRDRPFERLNYLAHAQSGGLSYESMATLRSAHAADEARAPKDGQQLLQVRLWDSLAGGDLAALKGTRLPEVMRELDQSAESIVAFARDSHPGPCF